MENKGLLVFLLAVGVFSILNTEMGIIGILPMVAEKYGIDIVQAGWLISIFALGVAVAGPIMPLLCSKFNRKKVMLGVLLIFTICNIVAIVAPNFEVLMAARVIPAFFHPVYCALAFSVAAASVEPENAPKAVARINMGVASGMVIGVPISNFLAAQFQLEFAMAFFAAVTAFCLVMTWFVVPDMPVTKAMSYGSQLRVLTRPMVWVSILAVVFLNGSIFAAYNYLADYLARVTLADAGICSILLFVYGVMNMVGSWLAGQLLAKTPLRTVCLFPICMLALYAVLFSGGGTILLLMSGLLVLWGILGGINANINQYWLARAVPDAPDFGNGLFLTAANIGCMAGTFAGGQFIEAAGISAVVLGGMFFAAIAFIIVSGQCFVLNKKHSAEAIQSA